MRGGLTPAHSTQMKQSEAHDSWETRSGPDNKSYAYMYNMWNPKWWNSLSPADFDACLNFTIAFSHTPDWLVVCASYREDVSHDLHATVANSKRGTPAPYHYEAFGDEHSKGKYQ